jgi:hypothetical protein
MMTEWLEFSTEWGYWINPGTFRMVRVKKSVLVGAVVLTKSRETLDTGNTVIVTDYGVARSGGVEGTTKKEASAILAQQMVKYMKDKGMHPPKTSIKKVYENGNVDLSYAPSEYDTFNLRFTSTLVDGDVEAFLDELEQFVETDKEDESWRIEAAKSGRSTCRTCGEKIPKDSLRLGEPDFYEDHLSYRWHHLGCVVQFLEGIDPSSLSGYEDLSESQRVELDTKF